MTSDFSFITDNIVYSFSSVNSFNICKYGFKLSYINGEERQGNSFAEFGTVVHKILEKYFRYELELNGLLEYYKDNYDEYVKSYWPNYPKGMSENYYNDGIKFFQNFSFDRELYDIIIIEDAINSKHFGKKLVIKPDLVLRKKETGKTFLIDYKTSKLKGGKYDDKKIAEYKKQFYLYSYFLYKEKQIEINEIIIWFIRNGVEHHIPINHSEILETLDWFENTIKDIGNENVWVANNTKENKYFCREICSFRQSCKFIT